MNYGTILTIRGILAAQGLSAAVAEFRSRAPYYGPADFCLFILGARSVRIR
jgi:hypothetical protein